MHCSRRDLPLCGSSTDRRRINCAFKPGMSLLRRFYYYYTAEQRRSMDRAAALVRNIRIVKPQPVPLIARLLRQLFNDQVRQPSCCVRIRAIVKTVQRERTPKVAYCW